MNENVNDKLRIQIFQIITAQSSTNSGSSSQLYPIGKKDIPIYSIVSRVNYVSLMNKLNQDAGLNLNESIGDLNQYSSSFSHGNNLNSMMGMSGSTMSQGSFKNKTTEKNICNLLIKFYFKIFLLISF